MNGPVLANGEDWYLKRQLYNFKNNIRGTHPDDKRGAQMMALASLLTHGESVSNVMAYINSTTQPTTK